MDDNTQNNPSSSNPQASGQPQPSGSFGSPSASPTFNQAASDNDFWQSGNKAGQATNSAGNQQATGEFKLPPQGIEIKQTPKPAATIAPAPETVSQPQQTVAEPKQPEEVDPRTVAQINLESREAEKIFRQGMLTVRDIIAPASFVMNPGFLRLGDTFCKTLFAVQGKGLCGIQFGNGAHGRVSGT